MNFGYGRHTRFVESEVLIVVTCRTFVMSNSSASAFQILYLSDFVIPY